MIKVLMVASIDFHFSAFHLPYIGLLNSMGCSVDIASRITDLNRCIAGANNQFDIPFERSPYKTGNMQAYKQLKRLIDNNKYDIIHCHTPVASILTRLVARNVRKNGTKVIYTAHGFHFFKGASLINWLLYFPIEYWMARFTDSLITITNEDYVRAQKFRIKQVVYIPGVGIDTEKFANYEADKSALKSSLGIPIDAVVLLSVGELNQNKNHQAVIRAVAHLKKGNVYYVVAGSGSEFVHLKLLAESLKVNNYVVFVGWRSDIIDFYKLADIFCLPSKREGLNVSLMEAMACGLPILCSNIRGNTDLVKPGKNGFLFSPYKTKEIAYYLDKLEKDNRLRELMGINSKQFVEGFSVEIVKQQIMNVYNQMLARK